MLDRFEGAPTRDLVSRGGATDKLDSGPSRDAAPVTPVTVDDCTDAVRSHVSIVMLEKFHTLSLS